MTEEPAQPAAFRERGRIAAGYRGRSRSVNGAPAQRTEFNAASGILTVTSPEGRATTTWVDSAGRAVSVKIAGQQRVDLGPGRPAHEFSYTAVEMNASYTSPTVAGISTPATASATTRTAC